MMLQRTALSLLMAISLRCHADNIALSCNPSSGTAMLSVKATGVYTVSVPANNTVVLELSISPTNGTSQFPTFPITYVARPNPYTINGGPLGTINMSASLDVGQYNVTGIITKIPTNIIPPIPSFDVKQINLNVTSGGSSNPDPQGGPHVS